MKKHGVFKEEKFLLIFDQILKGLSYMHSLKILHWDIKLENILLTHDDWVKICDFGISIKINSKMSIQEHIGTPAYLSPEVILKRGFLDLKSDVWSLGVMTFICLTGQVPFKGEDIQQLNWCIVGYEATIPS